MEGQLQSVDAAGTEASVNRTTVENVMRVTECDERAAVSFINKIRVEGMTEAQVSEAAIAAFYDAATAPKSMKAERHTESDELEAEALLRKAFTLKAAHTAAETETADEAMRRVSSTFGTESLADGTIAKLQSEKAVTMKAVTRRLSTHLPLNRMQSAYPAPNTPSGGEHRDNVTHVQHTFHRRLEGHAKFWPPAKTVREPVEEPAGEPVGESIGSSTAAHDANSEEPKEKKKTEGVLMASFSQDGDCLVTAGGDANAIVWTRQSTISKPSDGGTKNEVTIGEWKKYAVIKHTAKDIGHSMTSAVFAPRSVNWSTSVTAEECSYVMKHGVDQDQVAPLTEASRSRGHTGTDVLESAIFASFHKEDSISLEACSKKDQASDTLGVCHVLTAGDSGWVKLYEVDLNSKKREDKIPTIIGKFSHGEDGEGTPVRIRSAKFAPSGIFVAAADFDHNVCIWKVTGHKPEDDHFYPNLQGEIKKKGSVKFDCIRILCHMHPLVWSAEWLPMQESDSILTASGGNVAVLWSGLNLQHQADDAKMEHDGKDTFILKGHTGSVTHAAFHSKKPLIATCSYDSTVMLWSKDTKQRIHTFEGHTDRVWSVAFSNPTTTANNFIVSAGADCTSRIWDIDAQVCVAVLTGFTASIWSASFIPHSTKCKDARLDEATIRTAFGGRIITTSKDADIVCWDSRAREGISIFRPTGDHAECTACAYSSQSTSELVTSSKSTSGDSSGIVRIWSLRALARETQLKQEDEALKQERKDKARSFESRIEARLQELKPSELMDRWTVDHELCRPIDLDPSGNGHTGCVLSVDFSSDGNRLVTASTDLTAIVWERTSGSAAVDAPAWKMITRIRDTGKTSERRELSEARFHPNNSNVVVIGSGGKGFEQKHKPLNGLCFRTLKGCQGEVTVWTGGDDESVWVSTIFCDGRNPAHKGITRTVAWSTNGKQIISAGGVKGKGGSSVAVWNAATEDLVHRYVYFFHETI